MLQYSTEKKTDLNSQSSRVRQEKEENVSLTSVILMVIFTELSLHL